MRFDVGFLNRTTFAMSAIDKADPEVIYHFECVYTGYQRDDFVSFYRRELLARRAGQGVGDDHDARQWE